jgi:hypothetical protein
MARNENPELWSEEYFVNQINRYIKNEIHMYFFVKHDRKPIKEEYEEYFEKWVKQLSCEVTNFDLGIYED